MDPRLDGKVVLLTGATNGIGEAAAHALATAGATLVLVGRNRDKTERVKDEIERASGNPHVGMLVGDLSTLAGVRAVAAAFAARHDRLDVLANNAGAVFQRLAHTADGFELTFALNHLAYFLLTLELWDLLAGTPGARVICTTSRAHRAGRVDLDDVARRPSRRSGFGAYCDSKLMNILYTRELARRLAPTGVVANCFHPGWVSTGFAMNNSALWRVVIGTGARLLARTAEQGADTLVWLCGGAQGGQVTGEYFCDRRIDRPASAARDDAMASRLWTLSEELCAGRERR